jgi:hypothetical protein
MDGLLGDGKLLRRHWRLAAGGHGGIASMTGAPLQNTRWQWQLVLLVRDRFTQVSRIEQRDTSRNYTCSQQRPFGDLPPFHALLNTSDRESRVVCIHESRAMDVSAAATKVGTLPSPSPKS